MKKVRQAKFIPSTHAKNQKGLGINAKGPRLGRKGL